MTRTRTSILAGGALLLVLAAPATPAQTADFTTYVAIGDSITAGFASGGLSETQQAYSYPALLNAQAGGGTFEQPLISEPGIPAQLALQNLSPLLVPKSGQGSPLNLTLPRPYNNLGIPGAEVFDVVNTRFGFPFYDLILRNATPTATRGDEGTTVWQQAIALQPTFVSIWIGANDLLVPALCGSLDAKVCGEEPLTQAAAFAADYRTLVDVIVGAGNPGLVLVDIPDVTVLPIVTTVPPFLVDPDSGAQIPLLGVVGGVAQPLTADDRVLLPAASDYLPFGIGIPTAAGGTGQPLPDTVVLDAAEIAAVQARTVEINAIIAAEAVRVGAAFVSANAIFDEIAANGVSVGGIDFGPEYLTGGLFSYDGFHPSATAHGLVANALIRAINQRYGSSILPIDLSGLAFGGLGAPVNGPVSDAELAAGEQPLLTHEGVNRIRQAFGMSPAPLPEVLQQLIDSRPDLPAPTSLERGGKRNTRER